MNIIVKYGVDEHTIHPMNPPTIKALKQDETLRAVLGYGDNVKALIDGVEQPNELLVPDNAVVRMETACNTKAK